MARGKAKKPVATQTKKPAVRKSATKKPAAKKSTAKSAAKRTPAIRTKPTAKAKAAARRPKAESRIDPQWAALVTELRAKEKARDAIDPFRNGWVSSDKQVAAWKELNDAVKDVRERMDRYMTGFPDI